MKSRSVSALTIRDMQADDLPQVMFNEKDAYPIPWSRDVFEDCLAGRNHCLVLEKGGQVIGHAVLSYVLDETHLLNLCISPQYARNGYGRFFLLYLINLARERSTSVFYLEVRTSNSAAHALYLSEGFNEVGVRPNYYPAENGREDALLMTLELSIDQYV